MRSERGYTMIEVAVVIGLIGVISAIALPVFMESNRRTALWNGAEQIGAAVRSARLKAISQNTPYRIAFNCPGVNELRVLVLTGDVAIDDDPGRCGESFEGDSGTIGLPPGVTYEVEDTTALQVTGRGIFSSVGGDIPSTITVMHGAVTRILTVSGTGQITFTDVE